MSPFKFWGLTRHFLNFVIALLQIFTWGINSLFPYLTVCVNNEYEKDEDKPYSVADTNWLNVINNGAMFFSIVATHFLNHSYGLKKVYVTLTAVGTVSSILYGFYADYGFWAQAVLQFFMGISLGNSLTMMFGFIQNWAPFNELGIFISIATATYDLPIIASGQYYAATCRTLGWQNMYYPLGVGNVILLTVFTIFYTDHPSDNAFVSQDELLYIQKHQMVQGQKELTKVPYKAFFTDFHNIIAIVIGAPVSVTYFVGLISGPTYINAVYDTSDAETGHIATIGYMISAVIKIGLPFLDHHWKLREQTKFYFYGVLCSITTTAYFFVMYIMDKPNLWMAYVAQILYGGTGFCALSFNKVIQIMSQQHAYFMGAMGMIGFNLTGVLYSFIVQYFVDLDHLDNFRLAFVVAGVFNFFACGIQLAFFKTKARPFTQINASVEPKEPYSYYSTKLSVVMRPKELDRRIQNSELRFSDVRL